MEIEFNPSQMSTVPPAEAAPKAATSAAPTAADSASQTDSSSLLSQLDAASIPSSDKIDGLKPLGSNLAYPPLQLLERIAALLAVHLQN